MRLLGTKNYRNSGSSHFAPTRRAPWGMARSAYAESCETDRKIAKLRSKLRREGKL